MKGRGSSAIDEKSILGMFDFLEVEFDDCVCIKVINEYETSISLSVPHYKITINCFNKPFSGTSIAIFVLGKICFDEYRLQSHDTFSVAF